MGDHDPEILNMQKETEKRGTAHKTEHMEIVGNDPETPKMTRGGRWVE